MIVVQVDKVDIHNPGQFFACCGLLELGHRIWREAEGWFDGAAFSIRTMSESATLQSVIQRLCNAQWTGELIGASTEEWEALEAEKKALRKLKQRLTKEKENTRKALGQLKRKGVITVSTPFDLRLDWWQEDESDVKTWAGLQENLRIVEAALKALRGRPNGTPLFDYRCVLADDNGKKVEPFCFDARRARNALGIGWSPDVQGVAVDSYPATELLCLIGLQRFRPAHTDRATKNYWVWNTPLPAPVAAAVACGTLPFDARQFRYEMKHRDDQRRYKAFSFARETRQGGTHD
jgi:CRISPR-associated protein Csb3